MIDENLTGVKAIEYLLFYLIIFIIFLTIAYFGIKNFIEYIKEKIIFKEIEENEKEKFIKVTSERARDESDRKI